jgi:hypothetical protein
MCTTSPTALQVLTMLWVNRTHMNTSPWPRSQPYDTCPSHPARTFLARGSEDAAAGDRTERMSRDHPASDHLSAASMHATEVKRPIGIDDRHRSAAHPPTSGWSGRIDTVVASITSRSPYHTHCCRVLSSVGPRYPFASGSRPAPQSTRYPQNQVTRNTGT